jgi:hypothetical protein
VVVVGAPLDNKQLSMMDEQIGKLIDQIKDHAKKRDFLANFYKEPISALSSSSLPLRASLLLTHCIRARVMRACAQPR